MVISFVMEIHTNRAESLFACIIVFVDLPMFNCYTIQLLFINGTLLGNSNSHSECTNKWYKQHKPQTMHLP